MPTIQNDFLPFATGPGANVVDQATYGALTALTTGFVSGTAQSQQLNKVWRQSSIMSAVIAQFIVAQTGQAAVDDGTTPTLLANFTKAVNAASKQRVILTDTGSVNALAAANAVPMTALPTVSGVVQTIAVKVTNTGASTYSPDGLASRPIFGLGGAALQGGEMPTNGIATLVSYVGPLLNGGTLCWVLFECIGGAQQVAPATQGQHALQLGQATGRLLRTTVYINSGGTLQSSVDGAAYSNASSTFTALTLTTSVEAEVLGGGGGGGGAASTGSGQVSAGAGGGAGGYARKRIMSGFSGVAVTVGAGGTGSAGGAGTAGGSSSFGALISATGGTGGSLGAAASSSTNSLNGGAAGGIGSGGTINSAGGVGQAAFYAPIAVSGKGGASMFGEGAAPVSGTSAGNSSVSYGSGGSGGSLGASSAAAAGGNGSGGLVIVREYA
ncbi:hypothetical protein SB394_02905 [Burkholderia sp. BCCIQ04A]|uniref:Glycine-rich domain-containing protein n=1 Tax=Burkholderia anthinoferrum TaxID=3090833 RepID=A0ABU5WTU9_9BURK|nr:hypothetical protein [Burkholderia anthinoferrum]MEB2535916.1 hypothetical protein [Burkholderia anthinoferrum]MEB2562044.1 hypothetical protein [Burkholderia anthinoferrum]MEB2582344.1 hypothetical protein [Burkholderia anthinoferrum]MEB2632670.1 hypothetical protein [Burkholderia anthinoferrum]